MDSSQQKKNDSATDPKVSNELGTQIQQKNDGLNMQACKPAPTTNAEEESAEESKNKINEEPTQNMQPEGAVGGLSDYLTKLLLRAFEGSGEFCKDFDLVGFCDCNEDTFGGRGSELRRQVTFRWNKVKRRTIKGYVRYLTDREVEAGSVTKAGLELEKTKPRPSARLPNKITTTTMTAEDDSDYSSKSSSVTSVEDATASTISTSSTSSKKGAKCNVKSHKMKKASKCFSPERWKKLPPASSDDDDSVEEKRCRQTVAGGGSDYHQHTFGETSMMGTLANTTPLACIPSTWLMRQCGTKTFPWIIQVDQERPEGHGFFDVQYVENIVVDSHFLMNGFHIRLAVAPLDYEAWRAIIPGGYPKQYAKRLMLVKGPSLNYSQRNTKNYHDSAPIDCSATEKAHGATQVSIGKDDERQWMYFLIVFHPALF